MERLHNGPVSHDLSEQQQRFMESVYKVWRRSCVAGLNGKRHSVLPCLTLATTEREKGEMIDAAISRVRQSIIQNGDQPDTDAIEVVRDTLVYAADYYLESLRRFEGKQKRSAPAVAAACGTHK